MNEKFIKKKLLKLIDKHNNYELNSEIYEDEDYSKKDLLTIQNNRIKKDLCFLQIQYLKQLLK